MFKIIKKTDGYISLFALILLISITGANVFLRYVLNQSITWSEEVSLGLFVWLTLIGAGVVMKHDGHVGIDYFVRKLPYKLFVIFQYLRIFIIYLLVAIVFVYWGLQLVIVSDLRMTPVLEIPYYWIYFAAPLGGGFMLYHLTTVLVKNDRDFIEQKGRDII